MFKLIAIHITVGKENTVVNEEEDDRAQRTLSCTYNTEWKNGRCLKHKEHCHQPDNAWVARQLACLDVIRVFGANSVVRQLSVVW